MRDKTQYAADEVKALMDNYADPEEIKAAEYRFEQAQKAEDEYAEWWDAGGEGESPRKKQKDMPGSPVDFGSESKVTSSGVKYRVVQPGQ
jgi:hypothetical protein